MRDVLRLPSGECMSNSKVRLKVIAPPAIGHVLDAPPTLIASDHSVDYTCGQCETICLHSSEDQVYGLMIHCKTCGSYNSTET